MLGLGNRGEGLGLVGDGGFRIIWSLKGLLVMTICKKGKWRMGKKQKSTLDAGKESPRKGGQESQLALSR